jgi:small subunit ribosomal protein S21
MLIIPVKEGESIDRALKKFKKKFERTGVMKELRRRQSFEKPSITKRETVKRAIFRDKMYNTED